MSKFPIYLDYNATTPVDQSVIEDIHSALQEGWGNPSSTYSLGATSKSLIESSRNSVAKMINANSNDVVFMSGGTEANNTALHSSLTQKKSIHSGVENIPHVITSNVEHDSVIKYLNHLQSMGEIDLIQAKVSTSSGILDMESVTSLIKANTRLITIMHANNETGLLMPIKELGLALKEINKLRKDSNLCKIYFHTDAAQSLGKVKIDVDDLGVDYLTIVGHKFYGPRIGALYARDIPDSAVIHPIIHGGGQERGYRPGTENTPMIVGLGKAASIVFTNIDIISKQMEIDRQYFCRKLLEAIPGSSINFDVEACNRLPNTISFRTPPTCTAKQVLIDCDGKICASVGAACHSHCTTPSGSLIASGLSPEEATRTIRLSLGRTMSTVEMDLAVEVIAEACNNNKVKVNNSS